MNKAPRYKVNEQSADVRRKNFEEVSHGFDRETMLLEADRCLDCKNPLCVSGCPVGVRIPEFISLLKQDKPVEAAELIKTTSSLPAVCGRVCPQESQCEKYCVRNKMGGAVAIGALERYAADAYLASGKKPVKPDVRLGKRVAVVGSGPAGLTAAGELAMHGVDVTVYEAFHALGGVLTYGIPEFRLPKKIVKEEIDALRSLGVEFKTNVVIGKTVLLSELQTEYDAVFLGSGAGLPVFQNIKGENLKGVYSANEFLTRVNLMGAYQKDSATPIIVGNKVAVVGAGNVAMDAARTAMRLGAEEVSIIYRRSREEIPARREEVHHAEEEGVKLVLLTNPVEIIGEKEVTAIKCAKMELGEPDESGRRRPVPTGETVKIECDQVIMSLGTSPNPLIPKSESGLQTAGKGTIVTDETGLTSMSEVWAGGDAVTGAATVILAMGAGKRSARAMLEKWGVCF